jgi:hypothetical protein
MQTLLAYARGVGIDARWVTINPVERSWLHIPTRDSALGVARSNKWLARELNIG